ncbi:hypothetical protein D3C71_1850010 [compost metagenome]
MNRLQRAMVGLDRFTQCGHGGNGCACVAYVRRQTFQQAAEGLLRIAVQRHCAWIEVVELARIDVHPQQLAIERQALAPEIGVGHFGADCQDHVGFGNQVPARFYAQR